MMIRSFSFLDVTVLCVMCSSNAGAPQTSLLMHHWRHNWCTAPRVTCPSNAGADVTISTPLQSLQVHH